MSKLATIIRKHMNKDESHSAGFTVLELLISTAVFSVILLLCATAVVQVGRMFYKGATINRTQDAARLVTDDVIQSLQFGSKAFSGNFKRTGASGAVQTLCLGEVRYTYITSASLGTRAGQYTHVLWKDHVSGGNLCNGVPLDLMQTIPPGSSPDGIELLGENMRVPVIDAVDAGNSLWRVSVTVSYGEDPTLFTGLPPFSHCVSQNAGGQFCATSSVSNIFVAKRL